MAIITKHNETEFGVGDRIKVTQKIKEGDKERSQVFDGIVIGIKGRGENKTFTVRRIGVQQIGIERIFSLASPTIEKVEVVRSGVKGVKKAKLYYIRNKPKREIEKIYSKASKKSKPNKKIAKKTKTSQKNKNVRKAKRK